MEIHHLGLLRGLVHLNAAIYILMIVFNALGGIGYEGKLLKFIMPLMQVDQLIKITTF